MKFIEKDSQNMANQLFLRKQLQFIWILNKIQLIKIRRMHRIYDIFTPSHP